MARARLQARLTGWPGHVGADFEPLDLTPYLKTVRFDMGMDDWLVDDQPSSGRVLLENSSGALSPRNAGGPFYGHLDPMRGVRLYAATGYTGLGGTTELAEVLADSPTLLWKLRDGLGATTAADATGNGRTGTYNGSISHAAGPPLSVGYATGTGVALFNEGHTGDYVHRAGSGVANRSHSLWAEAWFLMGTGGEGLVAYMGDPGFNGFGFGIGSGNAETPGSHLIGLLETVRWIDTGYTLTVGWHHVAMTLDADGDVWMYVDGRCVYNESGNADMVALGQGVRVGGTAVGTGRWFTGLVYAFAMGNAYLTPERVEWHYLNTRAALYSGVLADCVPNPDRSVREAEMELRDPLEWTLQAPGYVPTYGSGSPGTHIAAALAEIGVAWPAYQFRSESGRFTFTPSFAASATTYEQIAAITTNDGGRFRTDEHGQLVYEDYQFRGRYDRATARGTFASTMGHLLPHRPLNRIKNFIVVAYNGGEVEEADFDSGDTYGRRRLAISAEFLGSGNATTLAEDALAALKDPQDFLEVLMRSDTPDNLRHVVMRTVGEKVTLSESNTAVSGDWRIEGRTVEAGLDGFMTATWRCSPA